MLHHPIPLLDKGIASVKRRQIEQSAYRRPKAIVGTARCKSSFPVCRVSMAWVIKDAYLAWLCICSGRYYQSTRNSCAFGLSANIHANDIDYHAVPIGFWWGDWIFPRQKSERWCCGGWTVWRWKVRADQLFSIHLTGDFATGWKPIYDLSENH